jgi:hypothetical protein
MSCSSGERDGQAPPSLIAPVMMAPTHAMRAWPFCAQRRRRASQTWSVPKGLPHACIVAARETCTETWRKKQSEPRPTA